MTREDFLAVGMRIQDIADETGLTYKQVYDCLQTQATTVPYKNRRENIKILERLLARKQKEQERGVKR